MAVSTTPPFVKSLYLLKCALYRVENWSECVKKIIVKSEENSLLKQGVTGSYLRYKNREIVTSLYFCKSTVAISESLAET